jgi:hypothetical protein
MKLLTFIAENQGLVAAGAVCAIAMSCALRAAWRNGYEAALRACAFRTLRETRHQTSIRL